MKLETETHKAIVAWAKLAEAQSCTKALEIFGPIAVNIEGTVLLFNKLYELYENTSELPIFIEEKIIINTSLFRKDFTEREKIDFILSHLN